MDRTPQMHGSDEIVVGLENREHWDRPLDWAVAQARLESRPLRLVHVVETSEELWHDSRGHDARVGVRERTAPAQLLLDHARERALERAPELVVHETLAHGGPREVLTSCASHARLLVLGARDRRLFRMPLPGAVGTSVTRHAPCPVVVVHADHPGRIHRGVLVGIDDGGHASAALRFGFEQASLHGWPLTVVHVAPEPMTGAPPDEQERLLLATAIAGAREDFPDVPVRTQVAHGEPAECLLRAGDSMHLIVVGAHHGRTLSDVLLGSVVVPLVARARCAVAVVPEFVRA